MKGVSPLASTVAQALRTDLTEGTLPASSALPSERILAEKHGVSRTIVREALSVLAREGLIILRDRCRPVVADRSHRAPHSPGTHNVAIWLWPYAEDYIASSIFRGIQRVARESSSRLIMASAAHGTWDEVLDSEAKFLQEIGDDEHIDGAVLWYLGGERNRPALIEAQRKGVRFVFVDRKPPEGIECDYVGTENLTASRNAVAHLVELGHRRIAFVGNLDAVSSVSERQEGYRRALEDAGLWPSSDIRIVHDVRDGDSEEEAIRRVAKEILSHPSRPTAVFAVNDIAAFGIYESFRDMGVRVPEDISIIGFDGLLRWLPDGGHVSTVVQNFTRIGELAAESLFERLRQGSPHTYRHVLLDAPLSLAGSTSAPASDPDLGAASGSARESLQ